MSRCSLCAVIIAGGKAERMEGREKGLLVYDGKPMCVSIADSMRVLTRSVFINANKYENHYQQLGLNVIPDLLEYQNVGPLGGMMATLSVVSSDYVLISPCDTPLVTASIFLALQDMSKQYPNKICYIESQSGRHPLHAILPVKGAYVALIDFLARSKCKSVLSFYEFYGVKTVYWNDEFQLLNVNFLTDLHN